MDISQLLIDGKQGDELPLTKEKASRGQESYSPHVCAACGCSFSRSEDFKRHQESHRAVISRPWSCRICSRTYETFELLEYHHDDYHGRNLSSPLEDSHMSLGSSNSTGQSRFGPDFPLPISAPDTHKTLDGTRWREPEVSGGLPFRSQSTDELSSPFKPKYMCCFDSCGKGFISATALEQHQIRHSGPPSIKQGPAQPSRSRTHLTWADKKAMCQYHKNNLGEKQINIAMKFGVERSTVSKVLRQKEMYLNQATDLVCVECGGTGLVNFSKCRSCVNAAAARLRHQRAKRDWDKKTNETSPGFDISRSIDMQQGRAHSPQSMNGMANQVPDGEDSRMSDEGSPSSRAKWESANGMIKLEDDPELSQRPHSDRGQYEMLRRTSSVASASSADRLDAGLLYHSANDERRRNTWIDISRADPNEFTASNQT